MIPEQNRAPPGRQHEERQMKKRWMNSVIEASKIETTVMPFQRGYRNPLRRMGLDARVRRTA